ncbi:MAG: hypothetical protein ACFB15_07465 [Cyclobacteriaceae bacterium]
MKEWVFSSVDLLLPTLVYFLLIYTMVIIYTRIFELLSFPKMLSSDFAMTVAVGTMLASVIVHKSPGMVQSGVALLRLYFTKMVLRQKLGWFSSVVDNQLLFIMNSSTILYENLRKVQLRKAIYGLSYEGPVYSTIIR